MRRFWLLLLFAFLGCGDDKPKVGSQHSLQVRGGTGFGQTWSASGAVDISSRTGNLDTTFAFDGEWDCEWVVRDYPGTDALSARIDENVWEYIVTDCYEIVVCIQDQNHVACPTR